MIVGAWRQGRLPRACREMFPVSYPADSGGFLDIVYPLKLGGVPGT